MVENLMFSFFKQTLRIQFNTFKLTVIL